ncbi:hypothetical protein FACS1894208_02100 [Clostridia bacterium]|nr:hypothetical protein FACS1894208_02100 [Clostridia bacterium]
MAKELLFLGREGDRVRLALFEDSSGETRKLPVKEISVETFIVGIKGGSLPVRGFGVARGRITCEYGDWYSLPQVSDGSSLTLFGLVSFGDANKDLGFLATRFTGVKAEDIKLLDRPGVASVDYAGVFRVLSPSTLVLFGVKRKGMTVYTSCGSLTKAKFPEIEKYDYTFTECDSVESLDTITRWLPVERYTNYAFLQWAYQRCEYVAAGGTDYATLRAYFIENRWESLVGENASFVEFGIALLGTKPLECLTIPGGVSRLDVRGSREIALFDVQNKASWRRLELRGTRDNAVVRCPKLQELVLASKSRVRLLRDSTSTPLNVCYWNGWEGQYDYTGLGIVGLENCFFDDAWSEPLVFDAINVYSSFCNPHAPVSVVFTRRLDMLSSSFSPFVGTLDWKGADWITYSFMRFNMTGTPPGMAAAVTLDLREVKCLRNSVKTPCEVLLPESFDWVEGDCFKQSPVRDVLVKPVVSKAFKEMAVTNDELSLHVDAGGRDAVLKFSECNLRSLEIIGGRLPVFDTCTRVQENDMPDVVDFARPTYTKVSCTLLDLRKFPGVNEIPGSLARECGFTTVIIGDNVKALRAGAFVQCNIIRFVYIPGTVTEVEVFILRPRIAYTIYTQQGSVADKYAKKNHIAVKYTDSAESFIRDICEIPEELEGGAAVSVLLGEDDGLVGAVKLACREESVAPDLLEKYPVRELCSLALSEVPFLQPALQYMSHSKPGGDRLRVILSWLTKEAPFNETCPKMEFSGLAGVVSWYSCGEYRIGGFRLKTTRKGDSKAWVILRGETVIHIFTEHSDSPISIGGVQTLLEAAVDAEKKCMKSTCISSVLTQLSFSRGRAIVSGTILGYTDWQGVQSAIAGTHVLLGIYSRNGTRAAICVDITSGSFGRSRLRRVTVWLRVNACPATRHAGIDSRT